VPRRNDRHASNLEAPEQRPVSVDEAQDGANRHRGVVAAGQHLANGLSVSEHAVDELGLLATADP
jgi:hypothetical protein